MGKGWGGRRAGRRGRAAPPLPAHRRQRAGAAVRAGHRGLGAAAAARAGSGRGV